ncbi:MAG TPA: GNAT family N-acetyltransferase [Solirubrobacteraceae bacterium]|jgi:RimJ/RimL family protein N-acetyltransferase
MPDPTNPLLPFETERLRVRALREDDLEALWQLYSDPRVARFIGTHRRDQVNAELRLQIAHQDAHGWSLWALEERSTGRFAGDCGLQPLELRGPEIELSYDLHPELWNRGLATEAATAVLGRAFEALAIDHVVAVVKPAHSASRRVLEKVGLSHAGVREAYGEQLLLYEARRAPRQPA